MIDQTNRYLFQLNRRADFLASECEGTDHSSARILKYTILNLKTEHKQIIIKILNYNIIFFLFLIKIGIFFKIFILDTIKIRLELLV